MSHPKTEELIEYEEGKLEKAAAERVREHLGTCDGCLDDIQDRLKEKLRADLHGLRKDKECRPPDTLDEEVRRNNERLVDEPVHREMARKMLTRFGMEKDETIGPMLRLLNDFDERLATLKSERR